MVLGSSSARWRRAGREEAKRLREDPEFAAQRERWKQRQERQRAKKQRWDRRIEVVAGWVWLAVVVWIILDHFFG